MLVISEVRMRWRGWSMDEGGGRCRRKDNMPVSDEAEASLVSSLAQCDSRWHSAVEHI